MRMQCAKFVNPLRLLLLGAACLPLASCLTLDKRDAFPVAGPRFTVASLLPLVGHDTQLRSLDVQVGNRMISAFYARHRNAHGVLIFYGGSGNQVDAALQVMDRRTKALGLDLVVSSYYQTGEQLPSVTEARAAAHAVYAAAAALNSPAARPIYVLGHSLGGWFALDVAANEKVRGLILVGAGTTAKEIIRQTYSPWASLVAIRDDADHRQLDAALSAPKLRCQTLVFTSRQDEAVPVAISQKVYDLIPASTPKRLVVLEGFSHGRYFLSDELWQQCGDFFALKGQS